MLAVKAYEKTVRRAYPPLLAGLIIEGYREPVNFRSFLKTPFAYRDIIALDYFWYYPSRVQRELAQMTFHDWHRPEFFQKVISEIRRRERALLTAARNTNFEKYRRAFAEYMPSLALVYNVENPVELEVRRALSQRFKPAEVNQLMNTLNLPLEDNYLRREEYELAQTKDVARHARKYAWILSRYGERRPYIAAMARAKFRRMNRAETLKKYAEQKAAIRKAVQTAKSRLAGRNRHLIDLLQFIVFYRTHRTDVINRSAYEFYPGFQAKARALRITYSDLLFLLPDEVSRSAFDRHKIKERRRGFASFLESGRIRIVSGRELKSIRQMFAEKEINQSEVKGVTACPGIVSGTVRLVRGIGELTKVRPGDILVASMTTPEFVPAMERAAAFITDEGGITCHAAIVSREMRKPCIIGTKMATKVFKDGDKVEVDAKKGVVRKL